MSKILEKRKKRMQSFFGVFLSLLAHIVFEFNGYVIDHKYICSTGGPLGHYTDEYITIDGVEYKPFWRMDNTFILAQGWDDYQVNILCVYREGNENTIALKSDIKEIPTDLINETTLTNRLNDY